MNLPDSFRSSMRDLLEDEYDEFISAFDAKSVNGIRINTSKVSVSDFEKIAPFEIEKIPFTENGYYIKDTDAWSKHPYYYAGLYYIQDPSAMLPADMIPLNECSVVLDLCAAPGGKSSGILTHKHAVLVSNDISFSRTIPLVKNLEMFGAENVLVSCEEPSKLAGIFPESFDSIVVDAPCSGEGMFRKDPSLCSAYEKKGPEEYCSLQREILESAYDLLMPGGYILYSTCTYSDIEDEQVVLSFLDAHSDLSVCDTQKRSGLCGPYKKYSSDERLKGCTHAFIHRFRGEGHFITLIKKDGQAQSLPAKEQKNIGIPFDGLPSCVLEFTKNMSDEKWAEMGSASYLINPDGFIYMIPRQIQKLYDRTIRYARTGVCIGAVSRHGKFTPHTAFALNIRPEEYKYVLSFKADDVSVFKYLRGETLMIDADIPAACHVLVCVDSFPLGFAYHDGKRLKNLYEKGWILR